MSLVNKEEETYGEIALGWFHTWTFVWMYGLKVFVLDKRMGRI